MDNDNKFKSGYCLEFAVALLDKYKQSKPDVTADIFLCQKLKTQCEDEFDYETSHAFIQIERDGINYGHDVSGIHKLDYFEKNCWFSYENEASVFEINGPFDVEDAESYLGSIEEAVMDEARQRVEESFESQWKAFEAIQGKIKSKMKNKIT